MTTAINGSETDIAALLVQKAPLGEDGLAALYRHYKPDLLRHATKRGATDPEGLADLALYDGFRAIQRLDDLTAGSFRGYLIQALNGHIVAEFRRSEPAEALDIGIDALVLDDPADDAIDNAWLLGLVQNLPPAQRDVIHSRFYLGLSGAETATRLGKDPNAVYQLQHRAVGRLRRAIFGGLLIVLAVVAVAAIRQTVSPSVSVDSSPAGQTTTEPAPAGEERSAVSTTPTTSAAVGPGPDGGRVETEATVAEREAAERTNPVPGTTPQTTTPNGANGSDSANGSDGANGTEGADTIETPVPSSAEAAVAPTPIPAAEPPTTVAPSQPATAPNVCAPHLASESLSAVKLFNPDSNHEWAAAFQPPAAIRFLDESGAVLNRVDTTGPFTTGRTAGRHGWIGAGDGNGTYAVFNEAPTPTYWGVLVAEAAVEGWVDVQWLDPASGTWSTVAGC